MNVLINTKEFLNSLLVGVTFADTKRGYVGDTKLTIKDDKLIKIMSFNGYNAISVRTECVKTDGSVECNIVSSILINSLKAISDETVQLSFGDNLLELIHSNGHINIPINISNYYPTPILGDIISTISIPGDFLKKGIKNGIIFSAYNDVRPVLYSLHISSTKENIEIVATDSLKMYSDYVQNSNNEQDIDINIDNSTLSFLHDIISDNEDVALHIYNNFIRINKANLSILVRKIEGRFPAYKSVINSMNASVCCEFKFNKKEIQEALNRVVFVKEIDRLILESNQNNTINISGKSSSGENNFLFTQEQVNVHMTDDTRMKICFNSYMFKEIINTLNSDFTICYSGDLNPIIIREEEDKNKQILLMPMAQ